jgi:hypothetical protein
MPHEPLTDAQLEQSEDWAESNVCPYPLGCYLDMIREAEARIAALLEERDAIGRHSGRVESLVTALEAENARLKEAIREARSCYPKDYLVRTTEILDAALSPAPADERGGNDTHEQQRGNLLALIHRDGGQYIQHYGWQQAQAVAEKIIIGLMEHREALEAQPNFIGLAGVGDDDLYAVDDRGRVWNLTAGGTRWEQVDALAALDKEARDA